MAGTTWKGLYASTRRIALAISVVAVLVLIGMAAFQDRLLYYPEPASIAATLAETGVARAAAWPSADDFRGVIAEVAAATPAASTAITASTTRGTAIVFHGNAGHAGYRGDYIDALSRQGLRVILAEYPGYGARHGTPGEAALVADASETIALARRQFGGPLLVVGESLGAGVASAAAGAPGVATRRGEPIDGLLLITPWDRLSNVAAHHYPWLPARWLLADRYDSVANLRGHAGPSAVVLAAEDRIVPARFGQALYEHLPEPKQFYLIGGADHNSWLDHVDDTWWRRVIDGLLTRR